MNTQQKISLWLGCVLFSVSNLWPPWSCSSGVLGGRESFRGFYFVSHDFGWTPAHVRPDFARLILEDAVILSVTLVAVLTMKGQAGWRFRPMARQAAANRFSRHQQSVFTLTLLSAGLLLVFRANWQLSFGILLLGLTRALIIGSDNNLLHYLCLAVGLLTLAAPAFLGWRQHRLAVLGFNRSVQRFEANIPRLAQRYPLSAGCFDFISDSGRTPNETSTAEFDPITEGGYEVVGEEQVISINNSAELYTALTQMGYLEGEKEGIAARIAMGIDSKKIGRSDLVLPCLSNPKSLVDFQVSSAGGSEFLSPLRPWFMDAVLNGVNVTSVPASEKPETEPPPFRVLPALWCLPLVSVLGVVIASSGAANLIRLLRRTAAASSSRARFQSGAV